MPSFKLLILFYSLSCLNPASGAVNLCQICHPSDITLAQGTVSPQTSGYTTNSNGCQSMNIACDKPNVAGVYMTMSFNKGQHVHLHNTTQPGGSIQFGLTCQSDGTWMNSQGEKVSEAACNTVLPPTTTPAAPTAQPTEAATTTTKKSRTTTQEPCDDSDNDSSDSDASSDDNDDGCGCKRHKHHSGSDESNGDSDDGCECRHKRRHRHRRHHRHHHKRHCPCRSDSGSSETEEPTRETTKTSSTTALPSSTMTTTQQIISTSSSTTSTTSTSPTTTTTGKDIFAIPSELRSSQQQCSIKALQAFQNGQTRQDFCSQNKLCFDLC